MSGENLLHLQNPAGNVVGPFLRFSNYDPTTYKYTASVMVVLHPRLNAEPSSLKLVYGPDGGVQSTSQAIHLDTHEGFIFVRFNLELTLTSNPQHIKYTFDLPAANSESITKSFIVPANNQPWRWMFYSCNGFHGEKKREGLRGIQPLWRDFFIEHQAKPFHVQFGTGDQIYNDPVWDGNCPSLKAWRKNWTDAEEGNKEGINERFNETMRQEVKGFYFMHYCRHFSEEIYKEALATVPFCFTWDDHDIFDGWGSYPEYLQKCDVFQSIYGIAKRFYLLFQQHTTEEPHRQALNWTWGGQGGFNEIKFLGSSVAVWMLDNRTERTRNQIAHKSTYDMAKEKLTTQLPPGIRHVVVVTTVPIVWPKIPLTEEFMGSLSGKNKKGLVWTLMNKTGLAKSMMSQFHEPNLLDDLMDHWTAESHQEEKKQMISLMQEVARTKQVRVSFISGDVHCAGIGRFYSYPKMAEEDFREDPRFMVNIISSAMGNEAPPTALMNTYEATNFATDLGSALKPTREKMVRRFNNSSKKFINRRNYCTVDEHPYDPSKKDDINNGCLNFTLRAEHPRELDKVDRWENFVPVLTTTQDKWAKQ